MKTIPATDILMEGSRGRREDGGVVEGKTVMFIWLNERQPNPETCWFSWLDHKDT